MTYPKEPVALRASARRAIAKGTKRNTSVQMALPLLPTEEEPAPTDAGAQWRVMPSVKDEVKFEDDSSRKENPVRRQRIKSPISVAAIKRVIAAAGKAGITVATLEIRPDGSIVIGSTRAANDDRLDVFEQWASRL